MPPVPGRAGIHLPREERHHRQPVTAPAPLPTGPGGLLALCFLGTARAALTATVLGVVCLGLWVAGLVLAAPPGLMLFLGLVVLPVGVLGLPVTGVLLGQRLPADYRQLGLRPQLHLWLNGPRLRRWALPPGAWMEPGLRRYAPLIIAHERRLARLSRGARAALAAELIRSLPPALSGADAAASIEEALSRIERWELAADGLPPVGAKLYLGHDPLSRRATRVRRTVSRLGIISDRLNYFWRGQVLLLPPARSYRTLALLIDALVDLGVADPGRPLPLQITVQGDLEDEAKWIAFAQLLASGLDLSLAGPERAGDEGNIIARGRVSPEPVPGVPPGPSRTDFLFSLVWSPVPELAAAGYADQHTRDLRVVQHLAAALLAARAGGRTGALERRLAAIWREFVTALSAACADWGLTEVVQARYLDEPFVAVQPYLGALLSRKAAAPDLVAAARRARDQALALTELALAVHRLAAPGGLRYLRVGWIDGREEVRRRLSRGLKRVRRAIRAGARVALLTRSGDTLTVLLDAPDSPR
jgi:hypothetical protein